MKEFEITIQKLSDTSEWQLLINGVEAPTTSCTSRLLTYTTSEEEDNGIFTNKDYEGTFAFCTQEFNASLPFFKKSLRELKTAHDAEEYLEVLQRRIKNVINANPAFQSRQEAIVVKAKLNV